MCNVTCERTFRKTGDKIPCCKCFKARVELKDETGNVIAVETCPAYECQEKCRKVKR